MPQEALSRQVNADRTGTASTRSYLHELAHRIVEDAGFGQYFPPDVGHGPFSGASSKGNESSTFLCQRAIPPRSMTADITICCRTYGSRITGEKLLQAFEETLCRLARWPGENA
jgi:hypothetical protein